MSAPRLRLELPLAAFERLQHAADAARSGSTTTRVDIADLKALLRDHQRALDVAQRRGTWNEGAAA